jgi:hypothetical protein
MGKNRRIVKRRDFVRAGILGSIALSMRPGRLFSSIGIPCGLGKSNRQNLKRIDYSRLSELVQKYGAEFGAVKPKMRSE